MLSTKILLKELFITIGRLIALLIKRAPIFLGVKTLYAVTHEKGDIDGVITKRKYRRIKQSIRYKLWVWHNLRWLCKLYGINFEEYEKFYKNKKILRY